MASTRALELDVDGGAGAGGDVDGAAQVQRDAGRQHARGLVGGQRLPVHARGAGAGAAAGRDAELCRAGAYPRTLPTPH